MLPSVNILSNNLLALSPTLIPLTGATAFVGVIADYMNQVEAHPGGSVGIFALANEIVIPLIVAMPPVSDNSWIPVFANALQAGILAAIITPGTVTNPLWLGSGTKDVATLPTGAATITTIPAATAALISALASATAGNNPAIPFAQAINDCTLQFIFTCIGLGAPPALPPIPIPLGAE
jgi:hypothetical protein